MVANEMTSADFQAWLKKQKKKPSKYGNVTTYVGNIRFDSKAEARRYEQLISLQQAGEISGLKCHPRYNVRPKMTDEFGITHSKMDYIADFSYTENGKLVVEDVKGVETAIFKKKKALFLKRYPEIDFRMVRAK